MPENGFEYGGNVHEWKNDQDWGIWGAYFYILFGQLWGGCWIGSQV
jgi:hypothetical protein